MEKRFHKGVEGQIITHPERLSIPLKRKKPTAYSIWNDWAHKAVDHDFRRQIIRVAEDCPQHTILALTKRPGVALDFCRWMGDHGSIPENWWTGLTVCNQAEADEKIPMFLQVPGKKFLSIEPMLGRIDFREWSYLSGDHNLFNRLRQINAVILGGETGPGARPCHPDWVRSVQNQCAAAGVKFFFKSWGSYAIFGKTLHGKALSATGGYVNAPPRNRLLDGRTHDELPWRSL